MERVQAREPAVRPAEQAPPAERPGRLKRFVAFFRAEKTPEKTREERMKEAETEQEKETGLLRRMVDKLSGEEYLYDRRLELQKAERAALEKLWGEPAVAVIYHSHNSGSTKHDYTGSPDGLFTLDTEVPGGEYRPKLSTLLEAMGIDAIFVTDHDADKFKGLDSALADLNAKERHISFFGGTEMTSDEGHFIVLETGRRLGESSVPIPPAKTPAVEVAEWAFREGYDIMIPHPNPSRNTLGSQVERKAFGIDIGIERETAKEILELARRYGRFVYIAYANGTTLADYKDHLLGKKRHWWQFRLNPPVDSRTVELYRERAVWIAEADGHIKCEYPSNMVYFRRSAVVDEKTGKVSVAKISDVVARQKEAELEAWAEAKGVDVKDAALHPYSADGGFRMRDKFYLLPYFVREYARLIGVWVVAVATGKAKQYAAKPKRSPESQYRRLTYTQEQERTRAAEEAARSARPRAAV